MANKAIRDLQTVTPLGERIEKLIQGVRIHYVNTHSDERGDLCEIYNLAWGLLDAPIVHVYQVTVRPGKVRGWAVHYEQDDRLFVTFGTLKVVMYDARQDSPTHRMVNEVHLSEHNRGLIVVPRGVFHAVHNVGEKPAVFINMPTRPYRHENPDKYRLPPNNDVIPYRFEDRLGW